MLVVCFFKDICDICPLKKAAGLRGAYVRLEGLQGSAGIYIIISTQTEEGQTDINLYYIYDSLVLA